MPYTNEMFEKAQEIIAERRTQAEEKADAKRKLFETLEPEYKKWKNELILSVKEAMRSIEMEPEKARELLEEQQKKNFNAHQEIAVLLKKHGLPADYLETEWFCSKCEDTGISGSKLCSCHIDLLKRLAFDEAGKRSPLKFSLFSDFDLKYYDEEFNPFYKCSSRERMQTIFDFCKNYAAEFDTSSPNILMCGETGLGKTHLSLAIAGEVISKGYNVLYNSAQNIFNELQKERFGKTDSNGQYEAMVLECDLLVIDDLGVEFSTQFTNAALYNIINTRINTSLPTIISTNLDLKELEERYTRRVSSRLIGDYSALIFFGPDVRQQKK